MIDKEWAKEQKLRRTDMKTYMYGKDRIVYQAQDGKLYFRYANSYHLISREYCR